MSINSGADKGPENKSKKIDKDEKAAKRLIKEWMQKEGASGPIKRIKSEEDLEYIAGQLSEFLDCYVVLGYDMDGNAVEIYAAFTRQHTDSLRVMVGEAAIKYNS